MDGETRRQKIMETLSKCERPISGTELAGMFHVSRQVVVTDVALLRATNKNILSTNKGYLLFDPAKPDEMAKRAIPVCHRDEDIQDELYTIINYGGIVLDVVIEHEVYGQITVDLLLKDKKDVDEFLEKLQNTKATPLKALTRGTHIHTVEAKSQELLDIIETKLDEKGYLLRS